MMPQQAASSPTAPSIAVVEDDEDIRNNVCRFLVKSGFRAWGVESAEDFYVALLKEHAHLVLRGGIRAEQGSVDWLDEVLLALRGNR